MDRKEIKKRLFLWYSILWFFILVALYMSYVIYFVDTTSTKSKWVGLFAGAIGVLLAACKVCEVSFYETKNPIYQKLTNYFSNGANIFIQRIFKISLFFVFLISVILIKSLGVAYIVTFIVGAFFAIFVNMITTNVMTKILTRASQFFQESSQVAFSQIFNSGVIIAFCTVSFLIIPLTILFHVFKDYQALSMFVLGASIVVSLLNVSTSVSKHSLECASDVVVNYVADIEKKDRRNPLLLLNGVSKGILRGNIFSGDLFISLGISLVSCMTIGGIFLQLMGSFLPIIIVASGIFSSVIVTLFINPAKYKSPLKNMFFSIFLTNLLFVGICFYLINCWLPDYNKLIYSIIIGSMGGLIAYFVNSNCIFDKYKAVREVSNATISGFSSVVRQIIKEGFSGTIFPALVCAFCILFSFLLPDGVEEPAIGIFGISLAILAFVSTCGITIGVASYGMTTCSVNTVIDSYEEDFAENKKSDNNFVTEVGQNILALNKNFLNIASILSAILALIAFIICANIEQVDIINPYVMFSMIVGATIPYLYCGFIMGIVSKTARRLVLEVKKQFRKAPQILRYELRPDFEKCVDLSALNSCLQVSMNLLIIILIAFLIFNKLSIEALVGFVFAIILSTSCLLFMVSSQSNVIKSAKKFFENQFNYIKNTDEYNSIDLSEIIFTSFRELIVPALNAMVKLIVIVLLALLPLFV